MTPRQRALHRMTWLLLLPLLGVAVGWAIVHRNKLSEPSSPVPADEVRPRTAAK